jgi:NitT/TauT family transport system substrate-binding protein
VGLVAVLALAGCSSGPDPGSGSGARPGGPVEKVTVLTGFNVTGQDSFFYVGVEKGFFREAGLEVTVQAGTGTAGNLATLKAGRAAFAIVDMTGALIEYERLGGNEFRVFAAIYQRSVSCIMTLASAGINSPRDLAGKRIGYSVGGVNFTLFPTYARLAGIDPGSVKWVAMQPPQLRPTLIAGRLDAITEIVIGRPAVETMAGRAVTVLPYSDYLGDLYGNVLATSLATAMGNPGIVTRFRDAALRSLAYTVGHPDEAAAILHKYQPAYREQAARAEIVQTGPYVGAGDEIGRLDEIRVMKSIALLQGAGAIDVGDALRPEQVVSFDLTPATPGRSR